MTGWDKVRQRAKELRKAQTGAEQILWNNLRNRSLHGLKFRRQHPLGPYIVDFYCAQQRLIVELDGGIHMKQGEADKQRASQLVAHGYRVLRFNNQEVESELEAVLERIAAACGVSPFSQAIWEKGRQAFVPMKVETTAQVPGRTPARMRGAVRQVVGEMPTDRTFQGQRDSGWGLAHFEARWFDKYREATC